MTVEASVSRAEAVRVATRQARSTAMWVLPVAAVIQILLMLDVLRHVFVPPLVLFSALTAVSLVAIVTRPGRWTYLGAALVFIVVTGANAPILVDGIINPVASDHQWKETAAIIVGLVGSIAGIAAFIETRRISRIVPPLQSPLGEAAVILALGALLGASVIGLSAYAEVQASPGAGVANGVASAPTQAPVELTAAQSKFVEHALQLKRGPGTVYVVNRDSGPHTFDIDLGGRHYSYPIPPNSTVAVVMNLNAGRYTYWCALSGHRANGMEGILTVDSNQ